MMLFGLFGVLLVGAVTVVALVGGGTWLAKAARGWSPVGERERTALEILDERYARGELQRAEYQEMREALGG